MEDSMPSAVRVANFMDESLSDTNCLDLLRYAEHWGRTDLLVECQAYAQEHFNNVVDNDEAILKLSADQLLNLVSSDNTNADEVYIYQVAKRWFHQSLELSEEMTNSIWGNVRFGLMKRAQVTDILHSPDFSNLPQECMMSINSVAGLLQDTSKSEKRSVSLLFQPRKFQKTNMVPVVDVMMMFLIGGEGDDFKKLASVEKYDFASGEWSDVSVETMRTTTYVPPLTIPTYAMGVAILNEDLYVVGGNPTMYSVHVWTRGQEHWRQAPALQRQRCWHGVAAWNGGVYAVGGYEASSLASVDVYKPNDGVWKATASMNAKRYGLSVAVLNDMLYAIGGRDGSTVLASVERLDADSATWTPVVAMHHKRFGPVAAVLNDRLYVAGGYNWEENHLSSVEFFTTGDDSWQTVTRMRNLRQFAAVVVYQGKLFVIGGSGGRKSRSSMEQYDPEADRWTLVPGDLKNRRSVASAVCIHQDLL